MNRQEGSWPFHCRQPLPQSSDGFPVEPLKVFWSSPFFDHLTSSVSPSLLATAGPPQRIPLSCSTFYSTPWPEPQPCICVDPQDLLLCFVSWPGGTSETAIPAFWTLLLAAFLFWFEFQFRVQVASKASGLVLLKMPVIGLKCPRILSRRI